MLFPTNANQVQAFAGALYGVQVGSVTLAQVTSDITSGGGLNAVLNRYYSASFGSMTTTAVATSFATNLGLTGAALAEGVAYTTARLNAVNADARGAVISDILNLFSTLTADATFGTAATAWTTKVTAAAAYTGTANVAIGTVVVPDSVDGVFNLLAGVDNISGAAGNDTFNAVLQANGALGTTISAGDVINGGLGTDTLNISVAGVTTAFTIAAVQTNSVEKVLLNNFSTDDTVVTVATDLMNGLTTVGLQASSATGDTAFTNMRALVGAEMRNGAGDLTLTYAAAAVAGTADTQALTVSNVSAGGFLANGAETIAITTELLKSTLTSVASDKLQNVTVTGSKDLTITNALVFAKTANGTAIDGSIDASTFTGKLVVNASGSASTVSILGGSGDDTIAMAATLTKDDVINGGDGKDTITMAAAALTTQFAKVSGIETVAFTAGVATATMDISKLSAGVNTVQMDLSDADGANGALVVGTFTNHDGQIVNLKRTVASAADTNGDDGVSYVITNKTDTAADTVNVTLDAIGVTSIVNNNTTDFGVNILDVANFETVNLTSKKSATVTANEVLTLTDSSATNLNITGDADLKITQTGTKLTNVNASALDGKLNITLGANKVSVTGGAKDDTFNFAGNFNNDDTVVGGAGKDTLTATGVTGLTATTGKLNTSGVEIITLTTTGANTLDLTNVVGATEVSVAEGTQTITGLDLATKIVVVNNATLKVTAANATGTNDTLTVEQKLDGNITNVIEGKAIENLSLILNDTAGAANAATFTVSAFEGNSITVAESASTFTSGVTVALGNLHKNVTSVNTSGVKGTQSASAAASSAAVTFSLAGAAAAAVTGSAFADTFNIASTGAVVHAITGGGGTDTTNIAVKQGFVNPSDIATAKVNITVNAGDSVTIAAGEAFNAATVDITLAGGNSLSTFSTLANANTVLANAVKTFDASKFAGKITVSVADNQLDETVTITGGALATDSVTATLATAGTYKPKTVGVESLIITATNDAAGAAAFVLDLSASTGVTTVVATVGDADTLTVDKVTNQLIQVINAKDDSIVEAKLVSAAGASDVVSFELKGADDNAIQNGFKLKTTDIETVNIKVSTTSEAISLADVSITEANKFVTLNVTGDKALVISALNADVNVINAAAMTESGAVIQTGRSGTTAATYTGSAGADTFIMANAADAINGGAGTNDTLDINFNAILGGIQVDLSSKTDQVTTFNGSANAAVQVGFENVDLAGFTGTFGADITAAATGSKITGTANADIITGGAAADTITGGKGADVLTGAGGVDTFAFAAGDSSTSIGIFDTITDFLVGTDKLQFTGVTDVVSVQQADVQTAVTALGGGATAAQIHTAMLLANTTNLGVSIATSGGNTFVLFETTGANIDTTAGVFNTTVFIQLTGVSVIPTFAGDVVA